MPIKHLNTPVGVPAFTSAGNLALCSRVDGEKKKKTFVGNKKKDKKLSNFEVMKNLHYSHTHTQGWKKGIAGGGGASGDSGGGGDDFNRFWSW